MSAFKESAVRDDTVTSLKAMSQTLRKRATALSELAEAVAHGQTPRELNEAGTVAGAQARELEMLAGHLHSMQTYLASKE